jgi:hypothetical protein
MQRVKLPESTRARGGKEPQPRRRRQNTNTTNSICGCHQGRSYNGAEKKNTEKVAVLYCSKGQPKKQETRASQEKARKIARMELCGSVMVAAALSKEVEGSFF